jgi:DNA repair protein RecO (recombination protein O)
MDIYTEEKGLRSFIVNGVRTARAKSKASLYQVMHVLEILAYEKDSNKLSRIREANNAYIYRQLPFQIVRSNLGVFIIDLARNTIKEKEANPTLFNFLFQWLVYVDQADSAVLKFIPLVFAMKLSSYLGFEPRDDHSESQTFFSLQHGSFVSASDEKYVLDAEDSNQFYLLMFANMETIKNLDFSKIERKRLLEQLMLFYKLHVEGFKDLRSLEILQSLNK